MTTTNHNPPYHGYYEGQEVVTRRGKFGTVVGVDGDNILVRFGSREFPMRPTQVILATEYRRMMRGKPVPGQGRY